MSRVRRAEQKDMSGCAAVINSWIDRTEWFPRSLEADKIAEILEGALTIREIWVIGDPVEAYVSVDPETGQIGALYCNRSGLGWGKELLERAKMGRDFLCLNTHVPNKPAQRFYIREGFVPVSEHDPEPPETVRELRMEWHRRGGANG